MGGTASILARWPDVSVEEARVYAAEDVGADHGEFVGAFGIVQPADDGFERGVVDVERRCERVGRFVAVLFLLEVEEPGVVAGVGIAEELLEPVVALLAVEQRLELSDGLGAAVLGDAEEDDAVDDPLDREVQRGFVKGVVAQGEVAGQFLAPVFNFFRSG
jgi:hypothetical protein